MTRKPPFDPVQDRALIARVNRGDHAAFERIYVRYRNWVVSVSVPVPQGVRSETTVGR